WLNFGRAGASSPRKIPGRGRPGSPMSKKKHRPKSAGVSLNCVRRTDSNLLEFDGRALVFQGFLELLGFFLGEVLLDRLGGALHQVLGFLEAQARGGADFLDDLDLLVAGGLQNHVEGGLGFFNDSGGRGGCATTATTTATGGGLDA